MDKNNLAKVEMLLFIICILSERQNKLRYGTLLYNKLQDAKRFLDNLTGIEDKVKCQHCTSFVDKFYLVTKHINGSAVLFCPCCDNPIK